MNTLKILKFLLFFGLFSSNLKAQITTQSKTKSNFLENVQIGGGLGLGFGNGYSNIMVAPSAIYNFNSYFSAGLGLQYSYVKQNNVYQSNIYGGSILGLFNPIPEMQISAEVEELRVNANYGSGTGSYTSDFWNTALFLGAGYRTNNITIGARYNVLHKNNQGVYSNALMPFVRVYF